MLSEVVKALQLIQGRLDAIEARPHTSAEVERIQHTMGSMIKARLQGDGDGEDWTVVPTRPKPASRGKSKPAPRGRFTDEQLLKRMVDMFNKYWYVLTGQEVHFDFTLEDVKFLSVSDAARTRNVFLRKFFYYPPVVVECFAGVGGDTVTFLYDLNPQRIDVIEFVQTLYDRRKLGMLKSNVDNFKQAFPDLAQVDVQVHEDGAEQFFNQFSLTVIDLLYLDPPWLLPGTPSYARGEECTAKEMLAYFNEHVFAPLSTHKIIPKVICVKSRFGWEECATIMHNLPNFRHVLSIKNHPFEHDYYYHAFVNDQPDEVEWHKSAAWFKAYDPKRLRGNPSKGTLPAAGPGYYRDPARDSSADYPDPRPHYEPHRRIKAV